MNEPHSSIAAHGRAIALAMGFFTRLPTWRLDDIKDEDIGRGLLYFPLVGLVIGLVTVLTGWFLTQGLMAWHDGLSFIQIIMIGFAVFMVSTLLTGGLHLDGLADCADAWVGGLGDRERTLEIMKDPTCGPMAVFIMLVVLMMKAAGVLTLVSQSHWLVLLAIPIWSRCAGMALFMFTDYVRPKGLGQAFSEFARRPESKLALAIGLCIPWFLVGKALLLPAFITLLFWWRLRKESTARLGGFTGDVAGAIIELTETSLLVTAALLI